MSDNSENIDIVGLIAKYLAKEADEQEIRCLENWVAADALNKKLLEEYDKSWQCLDKAQEAPYLDMDSEWKRLNEDISAGKPKVNHFGMRKIYRIAAVWIFLLLSASVAYYFINIQNKEHIIAKTEIKETLIPDGSKVTLNRNSSLQYRQEFDQNSREVILQGDAFFEVQPDPDNPFIVDAGQALIKVMGTSFFVSADKENNTIKVIVKTGKVAVIDKNDSSNAIVLVSGDKCLFSRNEKTLVKSVNADINYLSWMTKILIFEDKKLSHVVNVLNAVYSRNIRITDNRIKNCHISVTFSDQSLDEVLNVLRATLDIKIIRKKTAIDLSGDGC